MSSFFLKWLFIPTYKGAPITGLQCLLEYRTLVLFIKHQFLFEFETVNQPGFETGSPGSKGAMLIIELKSINKYFESLGKITGTILVVDGPLEDPALVIYCNNELFTEL